MAKSKPASKKFTARIIVHAVMEIPIVANSLTEALEAAQDLGPSDALEAVAGVEVNDWTSELQGVENALWIEYR